MAYKILLFDLDGTLIDPKIGITNAIQYALKQFGIHEDTENLLPFIGPPLNNSFQKYYGFSQKKAMEAVLHYRIYFHPKGLQESTIYNGITVLLEKLKQNGFSLAIVSSKPTLTAETIAKHHKLYSYFTKIFGSDMNLTNVDKPTLVKEALEYFDKPKQTIVMIGDREHDIFGAQANGIDSIGVLYGYGSEEELKNSNPTYIVKTIKELEKLLFADQV